VADVTDLQAWVRAFQLLATDDVAANTIRLAARAWVEENFDAHKNAARLFNLFAQALAS
jgi:glycosyltransferase involved in cell wall biosynthesis